MILSTLLISDARTYPLNPIQATTAQSHLTTGDFLPPQNQIWSSSLPSSPRIQVGRMDRAEQGRFGLLPHLVLPFPFSQLTPCSTSCLGIPARLNEPARRIYWKIPQWERTENGSFDAEQVWPAPDLAASLIETYFCSENEWRPLLDRLQFNRYEALSSLSPTLSQKRIVF
jgi:hypothetical protein